VVDFETSLAISGVIPRLYCIPSGVDARAVAIEALKHFYAHPEKINYPAAVVVSQAMQEAFPCRK
jgi:Rap1a immunity proteins